MNFSYNNNNNNNNNDDDNDNNDNNDIDNVICSQCLKLVNISYIQQYLLRMVLFYYYHGGFIFRLENLWLFLGCCYLFIYDYYYYYHHY